MKKKYFIKLKGKIIIIINITICSFWKFWLVSEIRWCPSGSYLLEKLDQNWSNDTTSALRIKIVFLKFLACICRSVGVLQEVASWESSIKIRVTIQWVHWKLNPWFWNFWLVSVGQWCPSRSWHISENNRRTHGIK